MKPSPITLSFSIISDREPMVKQIKKELTSYCDKIEINFINISANSGGRTNIKKVKAKLKHCHFIFLITSQVGHGILKIIYKLNRANFFDGQVIKIQGDKGKTAILRQIIDRASLAP